MPVSEADLIVYESTFGDGGAKSASVIPSGVDQNLWPDVGDIARAAGGQQIRKDFVANEHPTDALVPIVFSAIEPTGITQYIGIGVDSADDADAAQGNMTAFSANAVPEFVSDNPDTRQLTVIGENASGDAQTETVTLTGTTPKNAVNTYSKVTHVDVNTLDGSNTISVKEGPGGTVRGTIGPGAKLCFLWVNAVDPGSGLKWPSVAAGSSMPVWEKQTWPAGSATATNTEQRLGIVAA